MRISIGHRLFASVLLAILAAAAGAVFLLRANVLAGFGDYAVGIELDRLAELNDDLLRRYRAGHGWDFIPADARQDWIAHELARLQQARESAALTPPAPPAAPAAPTAPSDAAARAAPAALAASPAPAAPPAPPAPPVPPLPPLPPPEVLPATHDGAGGLPLARRITLFDANGRYLAGRDPHGLPLARRPLELDGRTVGWLGVARGSRPSDAMAYAFLAQLRASLWWIVAGAVAFSALAATLLARHFRRPIRALEQGARQLSAGRFDVQLPAGRSDELGELARHFNTLARHLASSEAARRQWVADTSHELRTPLAVLRAQLEALQDGVRRATPDTVEAMLRQVLALNKLIDDLYALARADIEALDCKLVELDLWRLASMHAAGFEARLRAAGIRLELGPAPPPATVLADPDRMRQVLDNLFENSLRYTHASAHATGRPDEHALVRLCARVEAGECVLRLDDSAPGVPEALLSRLGERFFRVDASRSRAHGGAGLGLALCRRLLDVQGAQLHFSHSELGGLCASIRIPLAAGKP